MLVLSKDKIDRSLLRLIKKKWKKAKVNKIRNEKEVTNETTEIQKTIREYYAKKLENLKQTDKFLKRYNFLRLYHEEIQNMFNMINTSTVILMVI